MARRDSIDPKRLRGWAKDTHLRLEDMQNRIAHLENQPQLVATDTDYVKFGTPSKAMLRPKQKEELLKRRARLCQVGNWAWGGCNDEGEPLLVSLGAGSVRAGEVYLAVHAGGQEFPPFWDWVRRYHGGKG